MDKEINISLINNKTEEVILISGSFSEEVIEKLNYFVDYSSKFLDSDLIKEFPQTKYRFIAGQQFIVESPPISKYDWKNVIECLMLYRPIYLSGDDSTNFYKTLIMIKNRLNHPLIDDFQIRLKDIYSGERLNRKMKLKITTDALDPKKSGNLYSKDYFDSYLDSYIYHHNKEKKSYVDTLMLAFPDSFSQSIFIDLLQQRAIAIYLLNQLINVLLNKQNSCTFNL